VLGRLRDRLAAALDEGAEARQPGSGSARQG